jgi:hypothetical protein
MSVDVRFKRYGKEENFFRTSVLILLENATTVREWYRSSKLYCEFRKKKRKPLKFM